MRGGVSAEVPMLQNKWDYAQSVLFGHGRFDSLGHVGFVSLESVSHVIFASIPRRSSALFSR